MSATYVIKLEVNGEVVQVEVEGRETLLDLLRTRVGLTGTHAGCEYGACGACTVTVDGELARSCLVLAVQAGGRRVTTIEGVSGPDGLNPVQDALRRHHGLQCGFCTPAMVLTAMDILEHDPTPTAESVREALAGNLCRCTGYAGLVDAVLDVAGVPGAGVSDAGPSGSPSAAGSAMAADGNRR